MDVIRRYLTIGIEGIPLNQLEHILQNNIKTIGKGLIILNDSRIVNCVNKYYIKIGSNTKRVKTSNQCFYIQNELGIKGVQSFRCKECHLECLNLHKDNKIGLKINNI